MLARHAQNAASKNASSRNDSTGNGHLPSGSARNSAEKGGSRRLLMLGLGALGIVYGDIGTSPLYALRACFFGSYAIPVTHANVLGVLSLIFWSLVLVISVKYLLFVMHAHNRGEGGILALLALLEPWRRQRKRSGVALLLLAIFGAALLYGDGMITPAISVLSAVEGLKIAAPALAPYVIPITVLVLIGLFSFQKRGTASVAAVFGPVVLFWFLILGALGLSAILDHPLVLAAFNPWYGVVFLIHNGLIGFMMLGGVFLVVTGGEALYADMGHFNSASIKLSWFAVVLPGLLLNYFGQGAEILMHPEAARHPFYYLVPSWGLYPMIALATLVTVIASQAVITGAFSLTNQAVQLGYSPPVRIVQTSSAEKGQIYIASVNWALMVATLTMVVGFGSAANLAAAYGMAVSTTMVITSILAFFVARNIWHWPLPLAGGVVGLLLIIDLAFWGANLAKLPDGGWVPLLVALVALFLMATWRHGKALVQARIRERSVPLAQVLRNLHQFGLVRISGMAVFLTGGQYRAPGALLHQLKLNQVLHEMVIFLTVVTADVPRVPASERMEVESMGGGFYRLVVHYGFMQTPNIPVAIRLCHERGLIRGFEPEATTYFLGHARLVPTSEPGMKLWRKRLYGFMARNALQADAVYQLPPGQAVELGVQIEF